ncbi:MAG: GYD domain-containing protein [Bacteroidetes bacterium]|nr:GYD domain-containing protein [Bacteroidota bacterium]MCL5026890.1 GYD domain-containing protein [Chloroflexota bacterium]
MPGYIVLYKYTQQGMANIKGAPERIPQLKAAAEKAGMRVVGLWITLGEYDAVGIFDAPNDQVMAGAMMSQASQGNVTTQTMRAFSEDEFTQIVSRLP